MRLFHVSEEANIDRFEPRLPSRNDLDKETGLVWAIDEARLPNFLTPRDCPRVTYHIGPNTSKEDIKTFFSSPTISHVVVIENKWFEIMRNTTLHLYEFNTDDFELQDNIAGYYVAKTTQIPKEKYIITDLFTELIKRNVEIRIVDNLWSIADKVKSSSLNYSLCRMAHAQPRMVHVVYCDGKGKGIIFVCGKHCRDKLNPILFSIRIWQSVPKIILNFSIGNRCCQSFCV